jgi:Zn-dependent peptidase ImmA (M78 family)
MKISELRVKEIENIALDVLTDAYRKSGEKEIVPPVKLTSVLDANQIELKIGSFKERDILGAYDKKSHTIFVTDTEPYIRKAFTIAHELGHYFLHEEKEAEFFYRSDLLRTDQDGTEETEANAFAAALLMPSHLAKKYWQLYKSERVLAKIFHVSNTTAFYRAKNLKLITDEDK